MAVAVAVTVLPAGALAKAGAVAVLPAEETKAGVVAVVAGSPVLKHIQTVSCSWFIVKKQEFDSA